MRIASIALGLSCIAALSACGTPNGQMQAAGRAAHPNVTSIGWVLEGAGKNADGQAMTHMSVYADTINDKGELERTNLFEVETMAGCGKMKNGDVRCEADGQADEFHLQAETSGDVTFGHRVRAAGETDSTAPFDVLHTFLQADFGTPLNIGPSRTTQQPK